MAALENTPDDFAAAGLPELRLGPLGSVAAAMMLDAVAPGLRPDEREMVLEAAAGNPLALEELPAAAARGAIVASTLADPGSGPVARAVDPVVRVALERAAVEDPNRASRRGRAGRRQPRRNPSRSKSHHGGGRHGGRWESGGLRKVCAVQHRLDHLPAPACPLGGARSATVGERAAVHTTLAEVLKSAPQRTSGSEERPPGHRTFELAANSMRPPRRAAPGRTRRRRGGVASGRDAW